jgi:DNA-binding NarL/FixJ family response regulator
MIIKIMLIDDHKIILDGLRALLEKQPDMNVVNEARDGRTAVRLARKLKPDIAIMDVAIPDLNGIEATRKIIQENPAIKVIALSMHSDRRFVVEMFKAGASGYLLKDCAFEEMISAINAVIAGQFYISPSIAGIVIKDYILKLEGTEISVYSVLTPREREVLQLLAEGKTTGKIASSLNLSEKTVETHRRQIMNKLEIYSIAELTKYAIREGLTSAR